jgi:hydroxycarboxylate dehydrogenase B
MLIEATELHHVITTILISAGCESNEAQTVANHLVRANLTGHDSHGVGMIPTYLRSINNNLLRIGTPAKIINDSGSIMVFDGQRGFGQRVAREAMTQAIDRCKETGFVLMGLRNAHHIGRVGSYGEQAIAAGLISLHFVNVTDHPPVVTVHNGADARLLTNPICFAMPGTGNSPEILLDMATSKIALGKARVAMNEGRTVDANTLLDKHGAPTTNPQVLFDSPQGAIKPFGDYKGAGIAFFCELLAGALTGGGTIQPEHPRHGGIVNNMLTILIDPERLINRDWLNHEIDALRAYALESPAATDAAEAPMLAGEPERRNEKLRKTNGIPIDPATWQELLDAGASVGLAPSQLNRHLTIEN